MNKKYKMNASISLDLDNQWAYMKVHGDKGWDKYPSYFDKFLPHGLKMLEKYNLKITFLSLDEMQMMIKTKRCFLR